MKILFYLPAITPWWFETIVAPMLRALHGEAELHVVVAPLWCNTGLEMEHVEPLADLSDINWHVVVPDDPAAFRLDARAIDGVVELVGEIQPDITIARSADWVTPRLFPGTVRYITEPGADPVYAPHRWFVLDEQPFHHGVMPSHVAAMADHAARLMAPLWQSLQALYAMPDRDALRAQMGLPVGRPVLTVPLQYEHQENFYGAGSPLQHGPEFIEELLDQLDERVMLAVSDHPLNRHISLRNLARIEARHPDRVQVFPWSEEHGPATIALVRATDAVLIDRSKCVSLAAFFGTPIVHCGDSVMADWLNATRLEALTAEALVDRRLPAPDRAMTRRWFGWHFGTRPINPKDLSLARLIDRIENHASEADVAAQIASLAPMFADTLDAAAFKVGLPPPTSAGVGPLAA